MPSARRRADLAPAAAAAIAQGYWKTGSTALVLWVCGVGPDTVASSSLPPLPRRPAGLTGSWSRPIHAGADHVVYLSPHELEHRFRLTLAPRILRADRIVIATPAFAPDVIRPAYAEAVTAFRLLARAGTRPTRRVQITRPVGLHDHQSEITIGDIDDVARYLAPLIHAGTTTLTTDLRVLSAAARGARSGVQLAHQAGVCERTARVHRRKLVQELGPLDFDVRMQGLLLTVLPTLIHWEQARTIPGGVLKALARVASHGG
ncbi:hypothetical protein [Nocardioides sp.]|uniref:hypothetical protein n=1 Tax=Nocardioides sp. TaxID=35761 RepID=UPI002606F40A|nr:hypothetical protein [Nocardioides sp.]